MKCVLSWCNSEETISIGAINSIKIILNYVFIQLFLAEINSTVNYSRVKKLLSEPELHQNQIFAPLNELLKLSRLVEA